MPDYVLELEAGAGSGRLVAGVDEAGRGPWAGPVVVAAVILDMARLPGEIAARLNDSKLVARGERDELYDLLPPYAQIGVAKATVEEIDAINILQATLKAMRRAVRRLPVRPAMALVDGNVKPRLPCPVRTVVKGDQLSLSIAAASIIAKVTRDRLMTRLARRYRGYGWDHNFGYGTREHRVALNDLGITPVHRRSFRPIWERLPLDALWTGLAEPCLPLATGEEQPYPGMAATEMPSPAILSKLDQVPVGLGEISVSDHLGRADDQSATTSQEARLNT